MKNTLGEERFDLQLECISREKLHKRRERHREPYAICPFGHILKTLSPVLQENTSQRTTARLTIHPPWRDEAGGINDSDNIEQYVIWGFKSRKNIKVCHNPACLNMCRGIIHSADASILNTCAVQHSHSQWPWLYLGCGRGVRETGKCRVKGEAIITGKLVLKAVILQHV